MNTRLYLIQQKWHDSNKEFFTNNWIFCFCILQAIKFRHVKDQKRQICIRFTSCYGWLKISDTNTNYISAFNGFPDVLRLPERLFACSRPSEHCLVSSGTYVKTFSNLHMYATNWALDSISLLFFNVELKGNGACLFIIDDWKYCRVRNNNIMTVFSKG